MSIKSFCAALSALAFVVVSASSAFASNQPIPGIDVVVKKKPSGTAITSATTDAKGEITLKELAPGQYTIELSGKAVEPAMLKGTTAVVALLALALGKEPATRPVTYRTSATAKGLQADIVIPEGPAKSYKLTLTR